MSQWQVPCYRRRMLKLSCNINAESLNECWPDVICWAQSRFVPIFWYGILCILRKHMFICIEDEGLHLACEGSYYANLDWVSNWKPSALFSSTTSVYLLYKVSLTDLPAIRDVCAWSYPHVNLRPALASAYLQTSWLHTVRCSMEGDGVGSLPLMW